MGIITEEEKIGKLKILAIFMHCLLFVRTALKALCI